MTDLPTHVVLAIAGFICGLVVGGTARASRFCTFGAIEDYVMAGRTERLRAWGLTIGIATALVSLLFEWGGARIDQTFYLRPELPLGGVVLGGLMFGFGMALVGTCGYGVLVRFGGGDLKALCGMVVLGLCAYATARGILAPVRVVIEDATTIDLARFGGQGVPHLLAPALGAEPMSIWLAAGLLISAGLLLWCFSCRAFRSSHRDVASGLVLGLVITAGFAATGVLGNDPFDMSPVESMTYVLPPGETLVFFLTYTGASVDFGIGVVMGTVVGAFLVAILKSELRLEAFDGRREMRRHLIGAVLMGFGGVLAYGCTVGQGMSGMATMSAAAPIALVSIFVGAAYGIHYLVSDGPVDGLRSLLGIGREG